MPPSIAPKFLFRSIDLRKPTLYLNALLVTFFSVLLMILLGGAFIALISFVGSGLGRTTTGMLIGIGTFVIMYVSITLSFDLAARIWRKKSSVLVGFRGKEVEISLNGKSILFLNEGLIEQPSDGKVRFQIPSGETIELPPDYDIANIPTAFRLFWTMPRRSKIALRIHNNRLTVFFIGEFRTTILDE